MRAATVGLGFSLLANSPAQQSPASYHDLLVALRDSLTGVQAALSDFRQDLPRVSRETVVARSRVLQPRCNSAERMIPAVSARIRSATTPVPTRRDAGALLGTLRDLGLVLHRDCVLGLRSQGPGSWADSLRAWAPYRGGRIDRAISAYEGAAGKFAAAMGFKLEPRMPKKQG